MWLFLAIAFIFQIDKLQAKPCKYERAKLFNFFSGLLLNYHTNKIQFYNRQNVNQVCKVKNKNFQKFYITPETVSTLSDKKRSSERVDYDHFLPGNGLFGSLQQFFKH